MATTASSPAKATTRVLVGARVPIVYDESMRCTQVVVRPGDCLLADSDSKVVIQKAIANKAIGAAEASMLTEDKVQVANRPASIRGRIWLTASSELVGPAQVMHFATTG